MLTRMNVGTSDSESTMKTHFDVVRLSILVLGCLTILPGCQAPPKASAEAVTTDVWGLRPGDMSACADAMARDLIQVPLIRSSDPPVRVMLVSIENETNEPFVGGSADMVLKRIQTSIVRALRQHGGRGGATAIFVSSGEHVEKAVERMRKLKRRGERSHAGLGDWHGADYFLSGVYHALDKQTAGKRLIDMLMTFELVDAETGAIEWTHDYVIKTVTRR